VSLCVGAISVSKIAAQTDSTYGAAMHTGASTNTGHATSVAYTSVQDTTLATQINNMSGQVQLTWDYWSIDNAGNVWIFANTATQK